MLKTALHKHHYRRRPSPPHRRLRRTHRRLCPLTSSPPPSPSPPHPPKSPWCSRTTYALLLEQAASPTCRPRPTGALPPLHHAPAWAIGSSCSTNHSYTSRNLLRLFDLTLHREPFSSLEIHCMVSFACDNPQLPVGSRRTWDTFIQETGCKRNPDSLKSQASSAHFKQNVSMLQMASFDPLHQFLVTAPPPLVASSSLSPSATLFPAAAAIHSAPHTPPPPHPPPHRVPTAEAVLRTPDSSAHTVKNLGGVAAPATAEAAAGAQSGEQGAGSSLQLAFARV